MNVTFGHCTKEEKEPQYNYCRQTNILWLDTIYWTFSADLKKMEVGHGFYSKFIKLSYIPDMFRLKITKTTPNEFSVQLIRMVVGQEPDPGYNFEISFSNVSSTCSKKVTYMFHDDDKAEEYFTLDEFYTSCEIDDVWTIKCVVWMNEYLRLDNDRYHQQRGMLAAKLKKVNRYQFQELNSVMRSTLGNFFMGRQDNKFAHLKLTLFKRSFRYSDRILSRFVNYVLDPESEESAEDLEIILGYIDTGEISFISKKDCIVLYTKAFFCGLSYLKLLCTDFIRQNLTNVDFLIDVLIVTDLVDDEDLMYYALEWFSGNKKEVLNSVRWNNFKNRNYKLACGFTALLLKMEADWEEEELEPAKHRIYPNYIL